MDFNVLWYDVVSSTNEECLKLVADKSPQGCVVAARYQTDGRGQRGNVWESDSGQNLTFSILLRPIQVEVQRQFMLSKVAALAVCDWISAYVTKSKVSIKWPNDVYVGNGKIAGILIENSFSTSTLDVSVIGIGVNVNQTYFVDLPNPISLALETGIIFNVETSLMELLECFKSRYEQLLNKQYSQLDADYFNLLYRKDTYCEYKAQGQVFRARIVGVKSTGELELQSVDGKVQSFAFKEISFVI